MKIDRDDDGRPFVELLGAKFYIGTEAECEAVDFVVCGDVSYFPDDERGVCADCGRAIVWRPSAPKTPPRICWQCASRRARAEREA